MNIKRLTHLITVLESVSAAKLPFDLKNWGASDSTTNRDGEHSCGTSACACGYAGLDEKFQSQGFRMQVEMLDGDLCTPTSIAEYNKLVMNALEVKPYFTNRNGELDGWDAVQGFFRIDGETAQKLFSPRRADGDETPEDVIARIVSLLELGEDKYAKVGV